jgi:Flp pilus assembly protein TadG
MTRFRSFWRDAKGATALTFALAAVPLVMIAGVAVDYSRAISEQTSLQAALDAATLAVATQSAANQKLATDQGRKVFAENFGSAAEKLSFKLVNGTVEGEASVKMPTALMNLALGETLTLDAKSVVNTPQDMKAEIALVLDYSGSMNRNGKYQAMRDAAKTLIKDMMSGSNASNIKFGIVPFSDYVLTHLPVAYLDGVHSSWYPQSVTTCIDSRNYPHATQSTTPSANNPRSQWEPVGLDPKYFKQMNANDSGNATSKKAQQKAKKQKAAKDKAAQDGEAVQSDYPIVDPACQVYVTNQLFTEPLTTNASSLLSRLDVMKPLKLTNIALALEQGWHVLTSNAPYSEGVPDNRSDTLKAIVLLTDGVQTKEGWGPQQGSGGFVYSVDQANTNIRELCVNIKKQKILLVTIAFQLDDATAKDILSTCASKPEHFFDASTNSDLASAFEQIREDLRQQVYISK